MKVRICELSFCEMLYSTQINLPSIGLTCSRYDKASTFSGFIGKRIILDDLSPRIDTEDLGQLAVIDKISEPVDRYKYDQNEDQGQKSSSDYHHTSLGIELLINTLLGRIAYNHIDSVDIRSLRSVAVLFDLALYIGLEPVRQTFEKSYSRTVRTA